MKACLRGYLVVLACVVGVLTSACRGDETSSSEGLTPTPISTNTPAPFIAPGETIVPVVNESALGTIRRNGVMRVGVLYNYPPFSQFTQEGILEGFEVELVRAMAEKWGVEVAFVQVTRQTGVPYLLSGEVDMLAAVVPHRREMHELVDFSQTVFRSGYLMLVQEESEIAGMADLNGRQLGIVEDASFEVVAEVAREAGVAPTAEQFATTEAAVEAMQGGQVAAVVGRREALMLATLNDSNLVILDEFLLLEPYAFMVRRGDANFRNLIDVTLQGLVGDGTYATLFNKHFYNYPADALPVWPGEITPAFDSQPDTVQVPAESLVARVARGEAVTVAGLQLSYDDPKLDSQRLLDDFDRALVNEMARRWGVAINEVGGSGGQAGIALVAKGEADLAVGVSPQRDLPGGVDFSQIYLQRSLRLARIGAGEGEEGEEEIVVEEEIEGIDDLDGLSAAVLGTAEDANLITTENTDVELVDVTSPQHALSLLQSRVVAVVMADEFTLGLMAREDPFVVIMEETFHPTPYTLAMPRFDSDFLALVNFTLQDMYADGTLARLVEQYFGPYAPSEEEPIEPFPLDVWPGSANYLGLTLSPSG